MSYERTRATLAKAHETLRRTSGIDADIAERRRLQELGLLPEYTRPRSDEPTQEADHGSEHLMTTALFEAVMLELIAELRAEWGQEIDGLRAELSALKRRRRRKNKSEDHSDDNAS
ncbi:hypothetical protein [Bradyrhizobium liaoningense]|uniref:hypothetical protein n=1 Tax=Bradyrhizobium liaoningense TaxID=43992 RepID=UPI001BAD3BF7|nr:hypothetical protein [Bradyrhizobium liaoningense]MBR1170710.1 hypothetical protein [Bradyrhizobium liaoningense]